MVDITFKDIIVLRNFLKEIDPKLRMFFLWVVDLAEYIEEKIVVTCAFEDRGPNSTSVHGVIPYRGLDLREWVLNDPEAFVKAINDKWIYDPKRPELKCARIHKNRRGEGRHLHLQVHPNTIRVA